MIKRYNNKRIYTVATLILVFLCGCNETETANWDKTTVRQLIINKTSDRESRYKAIDIARDKYHDQCWQWFGSGLANLPDKVIADTYIELLKDNPQAIPYLCLYAHNRPAEHEKIKTICQNISGRNFPGYLFDILNQPASDNSTLLTKADLWDYLCTYSDRQILTGWLKNISPQNELMDTISFFYCEFDYIPVTNGELLQCHSLKKSIAAESDNLHQKISLLEYDQYRFRISDYGLLINLTPDIAAIPRNKLINAIEGYTNHSKHITRPADYHDAPNDLDDSFASQKTDLGITDLLRLYLICQTIFSDSFSTAVITDCRQNFSETGGLCLYKSPEKILFRTYPPRRAEGEHKYIESSQALNDSLTAIARWHVHNQAGTSKNLAGPGNDDILFARKMKTNIIIFTLIGTSENKSEINIDLLTSDGKLIDLGCISN